MLCGARTGPLFDPPRIPFLTRPLAFVALTLPGLGLVVATGAVSLAAVRLATGSGAVLDGDEYPISDALSRILETNVTRHHCERCGWNGLAA